MVSSYTNVRQVLTTSHNSSHKLQASCFWSQFYLSLPPNLHLQFCDAQVQGQLAIRYPGNIIGAARQAHRPPLRSNHNPHHTTPNLVLQTGGMKSRPCCPCRVRQSRRKVDPQGEPNLLDSPKSRESSTSVTKGHARRPFPLVDRDCEKFRREILNGDWVETGARVGDERICDLAPSARQLANSGPQK